MSGVMKNVDYYVENFGFIGDDVLIELMTEENYSLLTVDSISYIEY